MKELTQEQKRIKLAESCGWTEAHFFQGVLLMSPPGQVDYEEPPDYFNDLNACLTMEKTLKDSDEDIGSRWSYIQALIHVTGAESMEYHREVFVVASSEAKHRAEAFGIACNLW